MSQVTMNALFSYQEKNGLTNVELAKKLGVSNATIANWKGGVTGFSKGGVAKVSKLLSSTGFVGTQIPNTLAPVLNDAHGNGVATTTITVANFGGTAYVRLTDVADYLSAGV